MATRSDAYLGVSCCDGDWLLLLLLLLVPASCPGIRCLINPVPISFC